MFQKKRGRKLFFIFCICLLFQSGSIFEAQEQRDSISTEEHEVIVRLVVVDVMATDKEGNIITDLTKEDFEIFEGGKPVSINSLDFYDFQKQDLQMDAGRNVIKRKKRFIVAFDSINTIQRLLNRSKSRILEKLYDLIRSGGEIMVLEIKEKGGIQLLQPFTSNEDLIALAVEKASGSIWIERAVDDLAIPIIIKRDEDLFPGAGKGMTMSARGVYEYKTRLRFEKTLSGLLSLMNTIKDYPGRKSVLLVSGGFPALSIEKLFIIEEKLFITDKSINDNILSGIADSDLSAAKISDPFKVLQKGKRRYDDDIVSDLINFANSHNITFYTMDPDSYLRYVLPDISLDNYEILPQFSSDIYLTSDKIALIKQNELSGLKYFALETGGRAFQGAKKFDSFQKYVKRDLQAYYELSYYPKRKKADGKYHKIKVKVKKPGIKIQFRKGYYDYKISQSESLLFASTSTNPSLFKQINFQARVIPFVQNKGKYVLWFNLALPIKDVVLSPDLSKEFKILKANFWLDNKDDISAFNVSLDIPVLLKPSFRARLQKARFFGYNTCSQEVNLKKGKYRMIFTLFDPESQKVGTVEQILELPNLKNIRNAEIVNMVFGYTKKAKLVGKSFSISNKDGTLSATEHKFYPIGINQFRAKEDISLFIQALWPDKNAEFDPEIIIVQNDQQMAVIPVKILKKKWNRKARIMNAIFNLDFSQIKQGDFILQIKVHDPLLKQEIIKSLSGRIL